MKKIAKTHALQISALRQITILLGGLIGIIIAYALPVVAVCVIGTGIVIVALAAFTDLVIAGTAHRVVRVVTKEK